MHIWCAEREKNQIPYYIYWTLSKRNESDWIRKEAINEWSESKKEMEKWVSSKTKRKKYWANNRPVEYVRDEQIYWKFM